MAGIPKDQPTFKDASGWKTVVAAPYKHFTEFKGEKPFPEKDETGRVKVKDRNV